MENKSINTKSWGIGFGIAVYIGVVFLALAFNVGMMRERFTGLLQLVAVLGMVGVALNAFALPLSLHSWAVDGGHRVVAIVGYVVDILAMMINAVASFAHYIGDAPAWVDAYMPYTPAAIMLPIATWALLFVFDPGNQAVVALQRSRQSFKVSVIKKAADFLNTEAGEELVAQVAADLATKEFNRTRFYSKPEELPTPISLEHAERKVFEEAVEALNPTNPPSVSK